MEFEIVRVAEYFPYRPIRDSVDESRAFQKPWAKDGVPQVSGSLFEAGDSKALSRLHSNPDR